MELKIKDEYRGMIISRNWVGTGKITFDANRAPEFTYVNFYKHGFEDVFDVVTSKLNDCCNKEICKCKKENKKKDNSLAETIKQVEDYSKKENNDDDINN